MSYKRRRHQIISCGAGIMSVVAPLVEDVLLTDGGFYSIVV